MARGELTGPKRVIYWLVLITLAVLWVFGYLSYVDHHKRTNPRITWGVPWTEWYLIPVKGALIWQERVVRSPSSGPVVYPRGEGPVKVPAGAVVARVGGVNVKAPVQGIFLARLDRMEGIWRYAYLWDRRDQLPPVAPEPSPPLRTASPGQPVGKVIEFPQEIRFLGYVPLDGTVPESIKARSLSVRRDRFEVNLFGEVRFYEIHGPKALVYMDLPWMTEEVVTSRVMELMVEAGRFDGIAIPERSVVQRDGVTGIYVVRGNISSFRPVEGRPIGGNRFLVMKGLSLGEAVIVDGQMAKEGRVQLW